MGLTRSYDIQCAELRASCARRTRRRTAVAASRGRFPRITVHGLGSHTGVGEDWADDQTRRRRAKRRHSSVPARALVSADISMTSTPVWVDLDQYNRPVHTRTPPRWALQATQRRRARTGQKRPATGQAAAQSWRGKKTLAKIRGARQK